MTQEATAKIEAAMRECAEKRVPAEPIAAFLKEKCAEDADFAALVVQEHKTLDKCFDFVQEQARNHLNSQSGWIRDGDVYAMAADYFALDDAEIERAKAEKAEKDRAQCEAREAERKQKEADAKRQKEIEASQKKAAKNTPEGQLTLFG